MSYSVQNIRNVCPAGSRRQRQDLPCGEYALSDRRSGSSGPQPPMATRCVTMIAEEIKRQITLSTAVAPVEYNGCKINVLDTPG